MLELDSGTVEAKAKTKSHLMTHKYEYENEQTEVNMENITPKTTRYPVTTGNWPKVLLQAGGVFFAVMYALKLASSNGWNTGLRIAAVALAVLVGLILGIAAYEVIWVNISNFLNDLLPWLDLPTP
jgi:hypothetical protein